MMRRRLVFDGFESMADAGKFVDEVVRRFDLTGLTMTYDCADLENAHAFFHHQGHVVFIDYDKADEDPTRNEKIAGLAGYKHGAKYLRTLKPDEEWEAYERRQEEWKAAERRRERPPTRRNRVEDTAEDAAEEEEPAQS